MAGILVGSARISLTPDSSGFMVKARDQVKAALADVSAAVPIKCEVDAASVLKARMQLGPLAAGKSVPIRFSIDKASAARAQAMLGPLAGKKVKILVDSTGVLAADAEVMDLARHLDALSRRSADARVKLAGDQAALAQLDKLDLRLLMIGREVVSPKITIDGASKAAVQLSAVDAALSKVGGSGGSAGAAAAGLGAAATPMAALGGAAALLAPVLVTTTFGLTGLAAAAYGIYKPISVASQATGGLSANLQKLNPEQQQVARGILALGTQFHAFQQQMQPAVFALFNQGLGLAGHLMHDIQPVASATGKALGGFLGQIDQTFQSGTWQQFFGFMSATAGPDIHALGTAFTGLLADLPPLVMALQPVALGILSTVAAGEKLIGLAERAGQRGNQVSQQQQGGLFSAGWSVLHFVEHAGSVGSAALRTWALGSNTAATATHNYAGSVSAAVPPVQTLAQKVTALTTAMNANVSSLLTLQGDELGWQQALQTANTQLASNRAGLIGNSAAALANQQAVLNSTNAAVTFANDQLKLHGNLQLASSALQAQIGWLEKHAGKSKFARGEIAALRAEEAKIKGQIGTNINVTGTGSWTVGQSGIAGLPSGAPQPPFIHPLGFRAAGGLITGGIPGKDSVLAALMPGEVVVPTKLVAAGLVDHLRGMVPGFAQGGVVGSYRGDVPGLSKWIASENSATITAVANSVAGATLAGMRQAAAAAAMPPGSSAAAPALLAGYAKSLLAAHGWASQWPQFNDIVQRESGWNLHATNPSSGAYGIPQALPPGKMASAGADWMTNPFTQLRWMVDYIGQRWGSPAAADANEISQHWYDKGGWLPKGLSLAANHTGSPELVLTANQLRHLGSGGDTIYNANFDGITRASVVHEVRAAFSAMSMNDARRGRIGRQQ